MFRTLTLTAAALALTAGMALAAKDTITIGMVLEPPILDPTAGAAAAMALATDSMPRAIDVKALQTQLEREGAYLGRDVQ